MPGSSGGSITLRLGIAGSEEVKAALASLGPAGAKALREIEQAQAGPNAGLRALSAGAKDARGALEGMAGRLGPLGSALSAAGPAGVAIGATAAALIGATVALASATKGAMSFAEGIETAARAAGVSTKTLQTYRYAAEQSGLASTTADEALRGFATAFGLAGEGVKRQLQFFEKLGFTPEQLKSFTSVDAALDATVDKIAGLGNAADRAAFAKRLGLEALLPVLQEGAGRIAQLRKEALSLGVVMDEHTLKSLANAETQFSKASDVINIQFKSALVSLTPILTTLIGYIADLATKLNNFMAQFEKVQDRADSALKSQRDNALNSNAALIRQFGHDFVVNSIASGGDVGVDYQINLQRYVEAQTELNSRAAQPADKPSPPPKGDFTPSGGGRAPPDKTDEVAQHAGELTAQATEDLLKARKEELQAQLAATKNEQDRLAIQTQINQLDDAQRDTEITHREQAADIWLDQVSKEKGVTAKTLETATAAVRQAKATEEAARWAENAASAERDLANLKEEQLKAAQDAAELEKAQSQAGIDLLKAMQPLATTMAQRRDLALAIFDREEAQQERALQDKIDLAPDAETKAPLQAQLAGLINSSVLRRQDAMNANPAGPWDAAMKKMSDDTLSLTDEWQTLASSGIERFNADLFDAQGRVQNLGQVFRSVIQDMLKMLEQYLMRQAEIGLFGGGQGASGPGGGGLFSQIAGLFGAGGAGSGAASAGMSVSDYLSFGGYAEGGLVRARGTGTSDSGVARVSDREFIVKASAAQRFLPALMAMNADRPIRIPHYAGGGEIGGSGDLASFAAPQTHHWHIDASIHAPGADPAMLNRVIEGQKQLVRGEPQRWAAYAQAAGVIPKPRRR